MKCIVWKMLAVVMLCILSNPTVQAQPYVLSLTNPPVKLQVLGEGFVSTAMNERDFAISADGKEIYFTISTPQSAFQTIVYSKQTSDTKWTAPEIVSFAGKYSDLEPSFSSDGQTLYFASNRPLAGNTVKDFDIWKVQRTATGWGEPINMGSPINTPSDEFYPSIARNGNLYYTATYKEGPGREDIYVSVFKDKVYQKPVALDTTVNSKFYEFNAFVDPDEQYILFTSYGRKDEKGGGDLYMSLKDKHGNWQRAQPLAALNSKQLDYCPYVSPDGKSLFITSNRHMLPTSFTETRASYEAVQEAWRLPLNGSGNIFWIDFQRIRDEVKLTP